MSGGIGAMVWIIQRILSLLIAIGYAIFMIRQAHAGFCIALLLPLVLIWFPDDVGNMIDWGGGASSGGPVNKPTPGILISIAGWFFLVGFPVLLYFLLT